MLILEMATVTNNLSRLEKHERIMGGIGDTGETGLLWFQDRRCFQSLPPGGGAGSAEAPGR